MSSAISTFSFPNRIIFGPGALSELPSLIRELDPRSVCVITDEGLVDAGIASRAIDLLDPIVLTTLFDGVKPNPDVECVEAAANHLRDHGTDLVIGLGGGSAMDTAKIAALRLNHPEDLTRYEIQIGGDRNMTEPVPPIIAIPTTAGTGSEVGRSGVVTLRPANRKAVLCGPKLLPQVALCDPELTHDLPSHITAATGMDALTHNIEAYLSPLSILSAMPSPSVASAALRRTFERLSTMATTPPPGPTCFWHPAWAPSPFKRTWVPHTPLLIPSPPSPTSRTASRTPSYFHTCWPLTNRPSHPA